MRKFIFNDEEYEGIKISNKVFQKIGNVKGTFKYRGKTMHTLFYADGWYCYFI
jgi:hypothetical protein